MEKDDKIKPLPETKLTNSIAMKRILKLEKKNRIMTTVHIEKELYDIIRLNNYRLSDLVNIALEKHFREKGLL
jgi:hypothetical protein